MLLLLIDGLNLIRRVHAGVPGDPDDATHFDAAKTAIARSVTRALTAHKPTHAACIMDPEGPTWRHQRYPEYKQGRTPMPTALADGLAQITHAIDDLGVPCVTVAGVEADDVVATLAVRTADRGGDVTILSTDSKFCQLIGDHIGVFDHFRRTPLDREFCQQRFDVQPRQLRDWFALVGDTSLNLRGVRGVGAKTASRLLAQYDSVSAVYAAIDRVEGRLHDKLVADRQSFELSYDLIGFKRDVDVGVNLNQLRYGN